MLAMVVNDNARELDKRGALEPIAGKPAPTVFRECVKNLFLRHALLECRIGVSRLAHFS
ncbi:hypothetical protein [Pseudomonas laurylsulfativorans]|uniref:hypothetical protein n=1 Tax=Pseudomonas laurylsulfativorans TaxID=1943631 RepID=UPI0013FD37D8|nr:hypothetical protein [Pseudomonas laurylsulfativorans]